MRARSLALVFIVVGVVAAVSFAVASAMAPTAAPDEKAKPGFPDFRTLGMAIFALVAFAAVFRSIDDG